MAIDRRKRLRDLRFRCSCTQAGKFTVALLALHTAIYLAAALDGDFSGSGSGSGVAEFTRNGAGTVWMCKGSAYDILCVKNGASDVQCVCEGACLWSVVSAHFSSRGCVRVYCCSQQYV